MLDRFGVSPISNISSVTISKTSLQAELGDKVGDFASLSVAIDGYSHLTFMQ